MEITPHSPSMNYVTSGFPLSSEEAFKLFANSLEIINLITTNKTIVGAINELKNALDNLDLSDYLTKDEAERTYATLSALQALIDRVAALELRADDTDTAIAEIETAIADIIAALPNIPATISVATFTNPAYFTQYAENILRTTPYSIDLSYDVNVLQDIDLADGTLEVINVTISTQDVEITDYPEHFYIPAVVDFYDANGDYESSQMVMLDGTMSDEMNAKDLSIYFTGEISNTNQYTKLRFSTCVPYSGTTRGEVTP